MAEDAADKTGHNTPPAKGPVPPRALPADAAELKAQRLARQERLSRQQAAQAGPDQPADATLPHRPAAAGVTAAALTTAAPAKAATAAGVAARPAPAGGLAAPPAGMPANPHKTPHKTAAPALRATPPAPGTAPGVQHPAPGAAPQVPAPQEAATKPWAAAMAAVAVGPVARPARMRRRHWGLIASLMLIVILPLLVTMAYLWLQARDQYASTVGFTVRQEESASAGALAGGLAQFLGGSGSTGANARVLYEYIQSQELVARVQADVDLVGHYSQGWPQDPVFSIWPEATIEELTDFWLRMVRVSYDETSGLIEVQVRAMDPAFAQGVAERIVAESQAMINKLNESARSDALGWAQADLDTGVQRLREAREALTAFRATTQIVDPAADIQGRMGILNSLQQQLAQALVELDLLSGAEEGDPRRRQLIRRIEVIRDRISQERSNFASQDVTISDTDYPTLIARYEGLLVDVEVAEATYRAAQAGLDGAKSRAERQTLYLATYIRPTLAQKSEYPDRPVLSALAGFFLLMLWSVLALVYYSLRDRG